jgi:hypothetical protein
MTKKTGILLGCGILGGLALLCGGGFWLLVYSIMALTQPPVTAAERFLTLLGEGKTGEAYTTTASLLRNQQTQAEFAAEVQRLRLTDYASSSWSNRQVVGNEATLEGTMTTKKGEPVPLTVKLLKEGSDWRVSSVTAPDAPISTKATEPKLPTPTIAKKPPETKPAPEQFSKDKVPSEALLRKLTTDTLLDLDQAIKSKDFKAFHSRVAKVWQSGQTPEQMKTGFGNFNADLSGVKDVAPSFAPPPVIDKDGQLVVNGMYPSKPNRVTFEFRYVFEGSEWKLLRHNLSTSSN